METDQKKKILSLEEIEKQLIQLVRGAIEILTQLQPDKPAGCFFRKVIQLKPAQVTQFSAQDAYNIIRAKMPLTPDCIIKLCDSFITTYPNTVFLNFMAYATLRSLEEYKAEQFDCDDFSCVFASLARKWQARLRAAIAEQSGIKQLLPEAPVAPASMRVIPHIPASSAAAAADNKYIGGSPIGMCHGKLSATDGEHAFNFWINEKGDVIYIEPQTGEYITFGDGACIDFVYL